MRRLGEIRNWVHLLATIAAMPVSVAQSPLELIGNTPVCGELLISPESAIRHTQDAAPLSSRADQRNRGADQYDGSDSAALQHGNLMAQRDRFQHQRGAARRLATGRDSASLRLDDGEADFSLGKHEAETDSRCSFLQGPEPLGIRVHQQVFATFRQPLPQARGGLRTGLEQPRRSHDH